MMVAAGGVCRGTRGRMVALCLTVALGGCALFDSNVDFKSAQRGKPLEVPPELTLPEQGDRFAVPGASASTTYSEYERSRSGTRGEQAARPVLQPDTPNVRVERAGSQRWLVVQGKPEHVWERLKAFWASMEMPLAVELPALGVMETDWAEERAKVSAGTIRDMLSRALNVFYSTPERNKYRTRIEAGSAAGTTEVYVSHRQMYQIYIDEGRSDTRWQPQPADPDAEAEMLRRFAIFVGVEEKSARDLLAGAPARNAERSRLLEQEGKPVLEVDDRFDRAWRRVGLALDRSGFTVEDRNRSEGLFFVRYVDSDAAALRESQSSFWSKLAFWRDDEEIVVQTEFRIAVRGEQAHSYVSVKPRGDADPEDLATARKILGLLNDQLR